MIIKLDKLRKEPCEQWLKLFDNGELDVHKAFETQGAEYGWLYRHSYYDLINWQVQNNCFNWEKESWAVATFCPRCFDPKLYNWKLFSWVVARFSSHLLDPDLYNWEEDSYYVERFCPHLLYLRPKTL